MICKRLPVTREKPYYLQYAKNYTSQHGEDGILEFLFQTIYGVADLSQVQGYCIDVGAWDGVHWSNTNNLIANKHWGGFLVEADQNRFCSMCELYADRLTSGEVTCLNTIADCQGESSLLNLLIQNNVSLQPSFLTIDIDGADYHLWENISASYSPDVVCIEFNPSIPNDIFFIQPADIRVQKGSSLLALTSLGRRLDYVLVACTTFNAIFVHNRFTHRLPHIPNQDNLDLIHIPTMITEMFQTYDGELVYVGTKKLLWHDIALNSQQLQILSKKQQKFPFSPYEVQVHQELQLLQTKCSEVVDSLRSSSTTASLPSPLTSTEIEAFAKFLSIPSFQGVALRAWKKIFSQIREVGKEFSILPTAVTNDGFSCLFILMEAWISFVTKLVASNTQLAQDYYRVIYDAIAAWTEGETRIIRRISLLKIEIVLSLIRCCRLLEDDFYSDYWWEDYESTVSSYEMNAIGVEDSKYSSLMELGQKEKKKRLFSLQS